MDHYRIPFPVVLSDSTHGDIAEFELVTVRIRNAAGIEGLGYTYSVGRGGAAVAALIRHDHNQDGDVGHRDAGRYEGSQFVDAARLFPYGRRDSISPHSAHDGSGR